MPLVSPIQYVNIYEYIYRKPDKPTIHFNTHSTLLLRCTAFARDRAFPAHQQCCECGFISGWPWPIPRICVCVRHAYSNIYMRVGTLLDSNFSFEPFFCGVTTRSVRYFVVFIWLCIHIAELTLKPPRVVGQKSHTHFSIAFLMGDLCASLSNDLCMCVCVDMVNAKGSWKKTTLATCTNTRCSRQCVCVYVCTNLGIWQRYIYVVAGKTL